MAIVNGNNLVVQIGGVTVGVNQSCSINMTAEVIEQNHKGTGNFAVKRAGRRMATITANGLYDDADGGQEAVHTALLAGTEVTLIWGQASPADRFTCSAIVTSVELTGDENADAVYSYTFESTGTISAVTGV